MPCIHLCDYKKLLLGALCTLLAFGSLCGVDGAIEWNIKTSKELHRRVRSSFYLLGYCSAAKSPECSNLKSLLKSSEEETRGSLVRTAMLVYDAVYWSPDPNTDTPTNLWFACHDGQHIRVTPCDSAGLNALMGNLAAAMQQQGPVCIAGEMHSLNPAALAAAAAEKDTVSLALTEAFLRGLDMYYQTKHRWTWLVCFNVAVIVAVISVSVYVRLPTPKKKPEGEREPDVGFVFGMAGVIAATVAIKLGMDMFLQLVFGMDGTISWWWTIPIYFIPMFAMISHDMTYKNPQPRPVAGGVECTPVNKPSSEETELPSSTPATAATPAPCKVSGYQPVSTTEDKPPAAQAPTAVDLLDAV